MSRHSMEVQQVAVIRYLFLAAMPLQGSFLPLTITAKGSGSPNATDAAKETQGGKNED